MSYNVIIDSKNNMDNENKNFYNTMLFLLIETLKNAHSNIAGDITIFFKKDNEIVSIKLGIDYEFKKIHLRNYYFSISLCNVKGQYNTYVLPYKDIVGFCSDVIYICYLNHNYDYIYPDHHMALPMKLSSLFNEQVKSNIILGHTREDVIKITFFEQFPGIEVPQNLYTGDKLLVLVLEPHHWNFKLEETGVRIKFKNHSEDVYLPYNSIVTYFNNMDGVFLNRNVKIVEEDFEQDSNYIYDQNMIYVNFKEILKEEMEDDFNMLNFFTNFQYFSHNSSNKTVEHMDNLIIGDFLKKEED